MKPMMLPVMACVLGLAVWTVAADEASRSELAALKSKYEEAQATIDKDFVTQQSDALASYGEALDAYLASLKRGGKLDAFLELEKEKVRFDADRTITPESIESPYAKKAAVEYDSAINKANTEKQKQTANLARQYGVRLNALIKELMQADRIEDAKLVKLEMDRCEFILADIESRLPPVNSQDEAKATPLKLVSGTIKPEDIPGKYVRYRDGRTFNTLPGFSDYAHMDEPFEILPGGKMANWKGRIDEGCRWSLSQTTLRLSWEGAFEEELTAVGEGVYRGSIRKGNVEHAIEIRKIPTDDEAKTDTKAETRKAIPEGAKTFGGHHYLVVDEKLSWPEAKVKCEEMGGHLVCIRNDVENRFVVGLTQGKAAWIGGTDEEREGEWKWVTGEPFSYNKWAQGQPDNYGDSDYLEIGMPWGSVLDLWDDVPANYDMTTAFVCEWDY